MLVTRISQMTGRTHSREIDITQATLDEWDSGESDLLVQEFFPNLSADDREFLLTGITPKEWEILYPDDEAEDSGFLEEQPF